MTNHFPVCFFAIFRKKIIVATILPSPLVKDPKMLAPFRTKNQREEKCGLSRTYGLDQSRRTGSAP